jgi:hypothetical protein
MPMPDDPNKKMDELLKAYARERRKAPELYLHPATRKMLKGEVARVLGGPGPQRSWFQRFRSFWPQVAFAGSLCLVLGIAVLSLRQSPPAQDKTLGEKNAPAIPSTAVVPVRDAENDLQPLLKKADESEVRETEELRQLKREESLPALQPRPAAAPRVEERFGAEPVKDQAAAPTTRSRDYGFSESRAGGRASSTPREPSPVRSLQDRAEAKQSAPQVFYSEKEAQPTAPLSATVTLSETAPSQPSSEVPVQSVAGLPPAKLAAPAPQISADKLARANEITNLGAARRLQFVQVTNTPASAPVALFTSFQMEQLGNDIRFLDRDGSVYLGNIEPLTNAPELLAAKAKVSQLSLQETLREQPVAASVPTNAAAFSFTVQGTNISLGKSVVLTGQYFEKTNAGGTPLDSLAVYRAAPALAGARGVQRPEAQHMIIGTAVIGRTNQVPLRAVSRE